MRIFDYFTTIVPRMLYYPAIRRGWGPPINPLTFTFSVTAACQSRCKTCHIGIRYLTNPEIAASDLTITEIEEVFQSIGRIYFFNVSGGEPFLRSDLADIIGLACRYLKPRLIHIPTNAALPDRIETITRDIISEMDRWAPSQTPVSIKPSIDGIGITHDRIRGLKDNFRLLEQTIDRLLSLQREHPRLHVDLGTVISRYNLHCLDEIEDWVHARGIESFRHEIAEQRAEFHNMGEVIAPPVEAYEALVHRFKRKIINHMGGKAPLTRITEAVRLTYYDAAVAILKQKRQISPCYGGISNIHLNHDGDLWPCCVLGDSKTMGNVRQWNHDVKRLLRSPQAVETREYIAAGRCACPLANQWLNNILLTPRHMIKAVHQFLKLRAAGNRR